MRHEYTEDTIFKAMVKASDEYPGIRGMIGAPFEAFLDALPDLPGQEERPHPEIEFDEVQKGDRIDVLTIHGNREILTVEARTDVHLLAMGTQIPAMNYIQSIRLIDRPVVHPYPLDHPAIVVIEADGYEDTNPQVFVWTGNRYENDAWSFDADDITSWKPIDPAKVVADND